jgi:chromosome partitioning protein
MSRGEAIMSDQPVQKYSFREFLSKAENRPGPDDRQYVKSYEEDTRSEEDIRFGKKSSGSSSDSGSASWLGEMGESFDQIARERMMYEGSDRDEVAGSLLSQGMQKERGRQEGESFRAEVKQDAPQMRAEEKEAPLSMKTGAANAGQKTYVKKPLTGRTPAEKTGAQQRPRLIGICNQKGGVGKTTTAVNLATALAAIGKNVAIIDMDPQGNASTGLGIRRSAIRTSVYDVLFEGADMVEAAVTTRVPNLSVIPSSIHLSGAEIELVTADNREFRLKKALHRPLPYDYVIVDCPPSLNLLTLNALVAVDSILVPLQCEFYALEGLSHLVKTIERVQKSFNPGLDIHGIILTMYDQRNRLSAQVEDDVRSHFGDKVYKTVIPRNVRLSEAPSFGLPAIVYDMKCSGAQAYIKLAKEVIVRERSIAAANESNNDAQVA